MTIKERPVQLRLGGRGRGETGAGFNSPVVDSGEPKAPDGTSVKASAESGAGAYIPLCADFDAECIEVRCKVTCWLHAPERGRCPYLEQNSAVTD